MIIRLGRVVVKSDSATLSLRQVLSISGRDLSEAAQQQLAVMETKNGRLIAQYETLVWRVQALTEFQDLQPMRFPPEGGPWGQTGFLFFEALSALREAIIAGTHGLLHASFAVLRAVEEMTIFHLWWQKRLRNSSDHRKFFQWLVGDYKTPPLENARQEVFAATAVPPSGVTLDAAKTLYRTLCAYAHKPLLDQSATVIRGSNLNAPSLDAMHYWLELCNELLSILLELHVRDRPMCLFPQPVYRKFGFNPPLGELFDEWNVIPVIKALGSQRWREYQDCLREDPDVISLTSFVNERPELSDDDILASWQGSDPQDQAGDTFETRLSRRAAMMKAQSSAMSWAMAYKGPMFEFRDR